MPHNKFKLRKIYILGLFIPGFLLFSSTAGYSQVEPLNYFIVVGSFTNKDNAENLLIKIRNTHPQAGIYYNAERRFYYTYKWVTTDLDSAKSLLYTLQSSQEYNDAWIFSPQKASIHTLASIHAEVATTSTLNLVSETPTILLKVNPVPDLFLSLYHAQNDKVVQGEVKLIDLRRNSYLSTVPGNSYLSISTYSEKYPVLQLICDPIGYRKIHLELNLDSLLKGKRPAFVEDLGTTLMVHFDLIKYQKGDRRTLFNVYFYKDAAVMRADSKYELEELGQMMKDNPTYRIRLHGHTNGNYYGKILISPPKSDPFDLPAAIVSGNGSAKLLSELRAEAIKNYLIDRTIDATRIEIKGWGGKRPLFNKDAGNAHRNARVEIEVISD